MRTPIKVFLGAAVAVGSLVGAWSLTQSVSAARGAIEPSDAEQLESIESALEVHFKPAAPTEPARPEQRPPAPKKKMKQQQRPVPMVTQGTVRDGLAAVIASQPVSSLEEVRAEDAMRMALRRTRPQFERCFNQELQKQAPFNGFVVLQISVAIDGRVTAARVVEGNPRDRVVGRCIASRMRTIKLPALAAEADLLLPILLEAKSALPAEARASLSQTASR